jgi:VWFA-related protein
VKFFVLVTLALLAAAPDGQQVFRSGVDLVTVDVTVVDDAGAPVEGLGPDHFRVRVDGSARRVVSAEFVRRDSTTSVATAGAGVSSNETADAGRLILVAVDRTHIRRVEGRAALRAAATFIAALDRTDRVAAAPLTHLGAIEFTNNHASVQRYLESLTGDAVPMPTHFNIGLSEAVAISEGSRSRLDQVVTRECGESLARSENPRRFADSEGLARDPCPTQVEQESRALAQQARADAQLSIGALTSLMSRLKSIEGPKTIVLVSEGLVAEPQLFDMTALGAAAQAARVTLYVLQLESPVVDAADTTLSPSLPFDLQLRADGLARVAGAARGALFHLVGSDPQPFRRILRELSAYYLIAFEATSGDRDGRSHRIDVDTKASGTVLRARPVFTITTPTDSAAPDMHLVRLLRNARLATELPLRVATYTFRASLSGALNVLIAAETEPGAARTSTIGFVVTDEGGTIVANGAGQAEEGRYVLPVSLRPGRYRVKAGAVNGTGREGSVEHRFDVLLDGGESVRVSDFLLADGTPSAEARLRPSVLHPLGDRVEAYLEIYAPSGWRPRAGAVVFDVTPAGEAGALLSKPATFARSADGRWTATADLPLSSLAPGAYVAVAQVTLSGVPAMKLERPMVVRRR